MAKTRDAVKIIDTLVGNDTELRQMIQEETANATVASMIYEARIKAGLTQQELAERVGTKQPVIARLEDAEYKGHSFSMLTRIAAALDQRLILQMVARERRWHRLPIPGPKSAGMNLKTDETKARPRRKRGA